jgi:FAD:protein FMN transferase
MKGEARRTFECFGGIASVNVGGRSPEKDAEEAALAAEQKLLDAHERLSRFLPDSELSALNRDPRPTVPASRLLIEVAAVARWAGMLSDGLVDATLVGEIEDAGYRESLAESPDRFPAEIGAPTTARAPASAGADPGWRKITVDRRAGTITRPPGVQIDSGGIAKGLVADLVATSLNRHPSFAVDCCGDIRIGGTGRRPRTVHVADPLGEEPISSMEIALGAVATSGIGKRTWVNDEGDLAHHLLDPATGAPAYTGVIQATAKAPTAFLAEIYAKHAILSGTEETPGRLPYGGVILLEDGTAEAISGTQGLQAMAG